MFKPLNKDAEIAKSRRNLPSWQQLGCTYFITWRLADSVPAFQLKEWEAAHQNFRAAHPEPDWSEDTWQKYHWQITRRMEEYLDAGSGACVLQDGRLRKLVAEALGHFAGSRWELGSYVLMPNHVHVLLTPGLENSLSDILKSIKRHTSRELNRAIGKTGTPLWQEESFHHAVRSEAQLLKFQQYIRANPAKAGLAEGTFTVSP